MKAILEFNLPDENSEFECAAQGANYRITLQNVASALRQKIKYGFGADDMPKEVYEGKLEAYREVNDKLFELAESNKVDVFE